MKHTQNFSVSEALAATRINARNQAAAEAGVIELIHDLPPQRKVALIRQIMKASTDMRECHFQQIAADAGKAETDLTRAHWNLGDIEQ